MNNDIKEKLKNEYNCEFVANMDYAGHNIIKAMESATEGISYRYFNLKKDGQIEEIVDELLLAYFKSQNEITDENNY